MIGQYYDALPVFYLRALLWRTWLSCVLVCLDDCHTRQLIARGRAGRTVNEECGMAARAHCLLWQPATRQSGAERAMPETAVDLPLFRSSYRASRRIAVFTIWSEGPLDTRRQVDGQCGIRRGLV